MGEPENILANVYVANPDEFTDFIRDLKVTATKPAKNAIDKIISNRPIAFSENMEKMEEDDLISYFFIGESNNFIKLTHEDISITQEDIARWKERDWIAQKLGTKAKAVYTLSVGKALEGGKKSRKKSSRKKSRRSRRRKGSCRNKRKSRSCKRSKRCSWTKRSKRSKGHCRKSKNKRR